MKKKSTKHKAPEKPQFPVSFETFLRPGFYNRSTLEHKEPSCFNGYVAIRKYRITFEEVDEPIEVLRERILRLWKDCDNPHHRHPLQITANELGLELDYRDYGSNLKPK